MTNISKLSLIFVFLIVSVTVNSGSGKSIEFRKREHGESEEDHHIHPRHHHHHHGHHDHHHGHHDHHHGHHYVKKISITKELHGNPSISSDDYVSEDEHNHFHKITPAYFEHYEKPKKLHHSKIFSKEINIDHPKKSYNFEFEISKILPHSGMKLSKHISVKEGPIGAADEIIDIRRKS